FIADGNLQTAIGLIEEDTNPYFDLLIHWLRFIVTDSGLNIIRFCEEDFPKLGRENQKNFILYAINVFRQILLTQTGLSQLVLLQEKELDFVQKFSDNFKIEQLEAAIDLLEKTHYKVERNANPKILFVDLGLQLVLIFKYQTFPQGTHYIYRKKIWVVAVAHPAVGAAVVLSLPRGKLLQVDRTMEPAHPEHVSNVTNTCESSYENTLQ